MKKTRNRIFFFTFLLISSGIVAQDIVQWRGPNRDGKYPENGLLKEWPEGGPELILKKEGLGGGYSTPVLYKGVIYISGRRDSTEVLDAVSMDGEILWETVYGKPWMKSFQETRNTPTIEENRIYISGTMGNVNCIDAETGTVIWSRNTHTEFKAKFHNWGMAESLLLTENAVISSPVGEMTALVALDKKDGSLLWKTDTTGDVRTYVSPLLIEYHGQKLIIATTADNLVGIDPSNGEMFWKFDIVKKYTEKGRRISANTPLYKNGELFVSSGYDDTALMLTLADDCRSVSVKWTSDVLDVHHGGMVEVDGYIYGSNWLNNGNGNWICLDWDTGKVMYDEEWYNKGSIIYADNMLYIFEEKFGNMGLFEAIPDSLSLKGTFKVDVGRGPRWAHPSIYDGKLFLRHLDVLLVYDIKAE